MIQGPLNEIMQLLQQDASPWELVGDRDRMIDWVDVGEAMLIARRLDKWEQFLKRAPAPSRGFLNHLIHQTRGGEEIDLEPLLEQVRTAPFHSPVLEARIRLEQAVLDAAEGRIEQALERSEWAEVRLGSLGRGNRHHAMAIIVRMNILIEAGQTLRALHLCSEVTRDGEHDPWVIGHTRLIAGRIMAVLDKIEEAIRVTWIALCLLKGVNDREGAREAATMLLTYADGQQVGEIRLVDRTGLDLGWTPRRNMNPPASSGKILAMSSPGLHDLDRVVIEEYLSGFT